MRTRLIPALGVIATAVGSLFVAAVPSQAVPAWTRATGAPCTTCHFGGTNRLTKMGEDFLIRGHRMSGAEGAWAKPDEIKWSHYLSLSSKVRFSARTDAEPSTAFDVESLSIYTGGPLTKQFSYFVEHYLHERGQAAGNTGGQVGTATRSKLADAFLHYNSASGSPTYLYARAGQLYPNLIYTASSGGRVSIGRPLAINANVGGGNLYTPRDRSYGATVGYVSNENLKFEAGVVNSGGTNARNNLEEVNNFKDLFVTAEKEFDNFGSGIGVYAYTGRFRALPTATPVVEDSFTRYGVLAQFVRSQFEISGAWFTGSNDDPGLGGTDRRHPNLYYVEGAYNLNPELTAYARYDNQDNDLSAGTSRVTGGALGISQRLSSVGRLVAEYGYSSAKSISTSGTAKSLDRVGTVEVNWLF